MSIEYIFFFIKLARWRKLPILVWFQFFFFLNKTRFCVFFFYHCCCCNCFSSFFFASFLGSWKCCVHSNRLHIIFEDVFFLFCMLRFHLQLTHIVIISEWFLFIKLFKEKKNGYDISTISHYWNLIDLLSIFSCWNFTSTQNTEKLDRLFKKKKKKFYAAFDFSFSIHKTIFFSSV